MPPFALRHPLSNRQCRFASEDPNQTRQCTGRISTPHRPFQATEQRSRGSYLTLPRSQTSTEPALCPHPEPLYPPPEPYAPRTPNPAPGTPNPLHQHKRALHPHCLGSRPAPSRLRTCVSKSRNRKTLLRNDLEHVFSESQIAFWEVRRSLTLVRGPVGKPWRPLRACTPIDQAGNTIAQARNRGAHGTAAFGQGRSRDARGDVGFDRESA